MSRTLTFQLSPSQMCCNQTCSKARKKAPEHPCSKSLLACVRRTAERVPLTSHCQRCPFTCLVQSICVVWMASLGFSPVYKLHCISVFPRHQIRSCFTAIRQSWTVEIPFAAVMTSFLQPENSFHLARDGCMATTLQSPFRGGVSVWGRGQSQKENYFAETCR